MKSRPQWLQRQINTSEDLGCVNSFMMVLYGCGDENTSNKSLELSQANDLQSVVPGPVASTSPGNC